AVSSVAHHRAPVVEAPDFPPAAHTVIDGHPVSLDRANLAILAESRVAAALHGNSPASRSLMPIVGGVPTCPSVGSVTTRPIACVATRTSVGRVTTRPVGCVATRTIACVATRTSVGSVSARPIARVATRTSVGSVSARPIACVAAIVRAARRSRPLGIATSVLGRGCVWRARGRPAWSGRVGSRSRCALLLCRCKCGYSEKNQQYGPFRQDDLSSVAQIHSHSCEMQSSFLINPPPGRTRGLDKSHLRHPAIQYPAIQPS